MRAGLDMWIAERSCPEVGQQLGPIEVLTCDTMEVQDLAQFCGADAMYLFVGKSHCPTCNGEAENIPMFQQWVDDNSLDVAIVNIVFDDLSLYSGYGPMGCGGWKISHALSDATTFLDPTINGDGIAQFDEEGTVIPLVQPSGYNGIHYFLNRDGIIQYRAQGYLTYDDPLLEFIEHIENALDSNSSP